jgi:hypothetical protein
MQNKRGGRARRVRRQVEQVPVMYVTCEVKYIYFFDFLEVFSINDRYRTQFLLIELVDLSNFVC